MERHYSTSLSAGLLILYLKLKTIIHTNIHYSPLKELPVMFCHDKNMILHFADQYYHIRDSIGDCVLAGDKRWAGTFGVNVDFVARSHCSVAMIAVEDVQVFHCFFD